MLDKISFLKLTFIQHNFSSSNMIFLILKVFKPIQHFIQHPITSTLDGMLDWLTEVN